LGDIVASELERGLAANGRLGVLGERGEAVEFFEESEVTLGMVDRLEAAEVLVVLVEAADDAFDGVVGGGDEGGADAVDELGPVAFEEVENEGGLGDRREVILTEGKHGGEALVGEGLGSGVKDGVDILLEGAGLWV
jgi:hypothetical protein